MYVCKNCAGNVKFDIKSQKMLCEHCNTYYEPAEVEKESDVQDTECFDVTVFSCPQCGAEIMASENSAAEFCLYCGGSSILSSRIDKEKRPNYIIPFKKTKEDCIAAYKKKMSRALFAPKELKDPQYLNKFRGIYMPYWNYQVHQQGEVTLPAKKVSRSGDYQITKHYECNFGLDAEYNGLSHDASSYFADPTTECLAPYYNKDITTFTPALMSGFYADTADVSADLYEKEKLDLANEETYKKITKEKTFRGLSVDKPGVNQISDKLNTSCTAVKHAMYPVWFLTYRKKDRVMFATVNGQTGKVAADIPIERKKYILGSLLLAVPIFLLLNAFLVLKPVIVMCLTAAIALFTTFLFSSEIKKLARREVGLDDRGKIFLRKERLKRKKNLSPQEAEALKEVAATAKKQKQQSTVKGKGQDLALIIFIICISLSWLLPLLGFVIYILPFIAPIICLILTITGISRLADIKSTAVKLGEVEGKGTELTGRWNISGYLFPLVAMAITCIVYLLQPVGDWWYYGASCICAGAILVSITGIIEKYNLLSTHSIPQLHDRGGEANVQ